MNAVRARAAVLHAQRALEGVMGKNKGETRLLEAAREHLASADRELQAEEPPADAPKLAGPSAASLRRKERFT